MAILAPSIIEPWGQKSPATVFSFHFPSTSDAPSSWRIEVAEAPDFGTLHYQLNSTGSFTTARRVDLTYPGAAPALSPGRLYWWRARGQAPVVGPWSRARSFSPDPTAASAPYDLWARALLDQAGYPRTTTLTGSLLPTGPQVAQLLTLPYGSRVTLRSEAPEKWRPHYAADDFERTVAAGGWGTADVGGAWSGSGAAQCSVSGGMGRIVIPTAGTTVVQQLIGAPALAQEVYATIRIERIPSAGGSPYVALRARDSVPQCMFQLLITPVTGTMIARLLVGPAVLGAMSLLGPITPGIDIGMRWRLTGANPTRHRARAWRIATDWEPSDWPIEGTDTAGPQVAGAPGVQVSMPAQTTAFTVSVDKFRSDALTVDRTAEVVGWTMHLDALAGWEASIVSRDVEAGS